MPGLSLVASERLKRAHTAFLLTNPRSELGRAVELTAGARRKDRERTRPRRPALPLQAEGRKDSVAEGGTGPGAGRQRERTQGPSHALITAQRPRAERRQNPERRGHLLGRRAWACEVSTSPCGRALCPAASEGGWGGGGGGPGAEAWAAVCARSFAGWAGPGAVLQVAAGGSLGAPAGA